MPLLASTLSADPKGAVESDTLRAFRELQGRQRQLLLSCDMGEIELGVNNKQQTKVVKTITLGI